MHFVSGARCNLNVRIKQQKKRRKHLFLLILEFIPFSCGHERMIHLVGLKMYSLMCWTITETKLVSWEGKFKNGMGRREVVYFCI